MPHSAMSPLHQKMVSGVSPVCVATGVSYRCGGAAFAFRPACEGSLPVVGRVWCLWCRGPVRGRLGLELSPTRCSPEMKQHQTEGTCPVLFPEKLLWVGGVFSQTSCLPPALSWGHSQTGVCAVIFPCPRAGLTLE